MVLPLPFPESPAPVRDLPPLTIALVVGTVPRLINQTPAVLAGRIPPGIAVRIAANDAAPSIVSTASPLLAQRSVRG